MVVGSDGHKIFRQALDSRSIEDTCVAVSYQATVRQRPKTQVGFDLRINRYWSGLARTVRLRTLRAGSDRRRRHQIAERVALILADPFVIRENESLVFYNGDSAGDAELVAMEGRQSGVEIISRIQSSAAEKPVSIAMELVGPRLGDSVDDPA